MAALKHNVWYLVTETEDKGLRITTDAMRIPGGVLVRSITNFISSYTTSESMVFVPGVGIRAGANKDTCEICSPQCNEAV